MKVIIQILLILLTWTVSAQEHVIIVKVLDAETFIGVEGASIIVENTIFTSTDSNGNFELATNRIPLKFTISHVGYEKKEVAINTPPDQNIICALQPKNNVIDVIDVVASKVPVELSGHDKYSVVVVRSDCALY